MNAFKIENHLMMINSSAMNQWSIDVKILLIYMKMLRLIPNKEI